MSSICLTVWLAYRCYVSARAGFSASRDRQPLKSRELLDPRLNSPIESAIDDEGNAVNESMKVSGRNRGTILAAVASHRLAAIIVLLVAVSLLVARFYFVSDLDPSFQNLREPEGDSGVALESGNLEDCIRTLVTVPEKVDFSTGFAIESHVPEYCVHLYNKHRNAPSHWRTRHTAWFFASVPLIIALLGSAVGLSMASAARNASAPSRLLFNGVAVSAAAIALGLAAKLDWQLLAIQLFNLEYDSIGKFLLGGTWTYSARVDIVRDAAIAISLSYFCSLALISTFRHRGNASTLRSSTSLFVAVCAFVAVNLMLFVYAFPSALLVNDHRLAVIAGEPQYVYAVSLSALLRHWLWTYWFAILVYGAIGSGLFALAIWGCRSFATNSAAESPGPSPPISPDNPSRDGGPI